MRGVYAVALVSGLTDVDAISLSSFRLFGDARISAAGAVTTIVVALLSNIVVKTGIAFVAGGASLGRRCVAGFAAMAGALLIATLALAA
jgi:uncharacterized membrane protein (DUF4010 family)